MELVVIGLTVTLVGFLSAWLMAQHQVTRALIPMLVGNAGLLVLVGGLSLISHGLARALWALAVIFVFVAEGLALAAFAQFAQERIMQRKAEKAGVVAIADAARYRRRMRRAVMCLVMSLLTALGALHAK